MLKQMVAFIASEIQSLNLLGTDTQPSEWWANNQTCATAYLPTDVSYKMGLLGLLLMKPISTLPKALYVSKSLL